MSELYNAGLIFMILEGASFGMYLYSRGYRLDSPLTALMLIANGVIMGGIVGTLITVLGG